MSGEAFPCLLSGGIFGVPTLADETARRVAQVAPRAEVRRLPDPPATGAVRLAIEELAGGANLPRPI